MFGKKKKNKRMKGEVTPWQVRDIVSELNMIDPTPEYDYILMDEELQFMLAHSFNEHLKAGKAKMFNNDFVFFLKFLILEGQLEQMEEKKGKSSWFFFII